MSFPYKLVVCDIDGTLVDNQKRISTGNKNALERFKREGGRISFATGRIEKSVEPYCRELDIHIPIILYNGAKIIHPFTGGVVRNLFLTEQDVRRAISLEEHFPFDFIFYSEGEAYVRRSSDAIRAYEKGDGFQCIPDPSLSNLKEKRITKILMIGDGGFFPQFRREFLADPACRASLIQSESTYLEILPEGVNKGEALKELVDHLGLSMEQVICFGDNLNDLEMIRSAGVGVAMKNGRAEVRESADIIAPENFKDGVGVVLRSLMEGR
jgi:Cof subfamily protein (haloacid dehalogenase superfamily)